MHQPVKSIYELMENLSEDHTEVLQLMTMIPGFTPDFSMESLEDLENGLLTMFPNGVSSPATYIPFGWYLGEVIIQTVGAKWVKTEGMDLSDAKLGFKVNMEGEGTDAVVMPIVRIANFMRDNTDGIYALALGVSQMALNLVDLEGAKDGEWIPTSGKTMIRKKVMPKE